MIDLAAPVLRFEVGDLVWQQMYSPREPHRDSSIEERIAGGRLYGQRRQMRLAGVSENYNGRPHTRWWLVDPDRPKDESRMSWVASDWCTLEPVESDGMLW